MRMKSVNLSLFKKNQVIAVALSGGSDSVSLCHFLKTNEEKLNITVKAINIEHGIRGETSIADTKFVVDFCAKLQVPLLTYAVDCPTYAKDNKLTLEESARILRYDCFFDALKKGDCDLIATAHHKSDNLESVLFNLFRGTGLKGLVGIKDEYKDKIVRPMLDTSKAEIDDYIKEHSLPFVVDETNSDTDYTRNALRHEVIPSIEKIFPESADAVRRLSKIVKEEDAFLDELATGFISATDDIVSIDLKIPDPIFARAVIIALKLVGLKKDWEKSHIDGVTSLKNLRTGSQISLPKDFIAVKEYDTIVLLKKKPILSVQIPFGLGSFKAIDQTISIEKTAMPKNLKDGLYADLDKIPLGAIIRTKQDGDIFTPFGGKTKLLSDYFTDKKIPSRLRGETPVLAKDDKVLVVFGVAVSNDIKVDETTKNIIKFTSEK